MELPDLGAVGYGKRGHEWSASETSRGQRPFGSSPVKRPRCPGAGALYRDRLGRGSLVAGSRELDVEVGR